MDSGVEQCLPALSKDYYSYSSTNNLGIDYLNTIDEGAWTELKLKGGNKINLPGDVSLGCSYDEFKSQRSKYFQAIGYKRTEQQARDIVQITASNRTFGAYEACLRTVGSGSPIRVWAASETMDEITIKVKYFNPSGIASKKLIGQVEGGVVRGVPAGEIWSGKKEWGVMEEKTFSISRTPGTSSTIVTVRVEDSSAPAISLTFLRADALITMRYAGNRKVPRGDITASVTSPDNNQRSCDNNCDRKVGCNAGKNCISRTDITLSVKEPFSIESPKPACEGAGCEFAAYAAISMADGGRAASSYVDNWGQSVTYTISAARFETIDEKTCGSSYTVPVLAGTPVMFTSNSECKPLAVVEWKKLAGKGGVGVVKFGEAMSDDKRLVKVGRNQETGSSLSAAYAYQEAK